MTPVIATEVQNNDILMFYGVRCRASNVTHHDQMEELHPAAPLKYGPVARFNLTSEPNVDHPNKLPAGYDSERYGGNRLALFYLLERK